MSLTFTLASKTLKKTVTEVFPLKTIFLKFIITFLFCFLLLFPCHAEEMTVTVGLLYGAEAPSLVTLTSDSTITVIAPNYMSEEPLPSPITVQALKESNSSAEDYIGFYLIESAMTLNDQVISFCSSDGSPIGVNGVYYRGIITLARIPGSDMTVKNTVGIESYLYSVVGSEMYPSWHVEALKAQAVAARSYAYLNLGKNLAKYGFDITDTTLDQAYKGIIQETENVRQAVDGTRGLVAFSEGSAVSLYYYASNNGHTESNESLWGSVPVAYLRGKPDPYDTYSDPWRVSLTSNEIASILKERGADIGDLTNITIDKVTDAGSVVAITYHGTKDSFTYTKSSVRSMLGKSWKSHWFTLSKEGGNPLMEDGVYTQKGFTNEKTLTVMTADGLSEVSAKKAYACTAYGTSKISLSQRESGETDSTGATWVFSGDGSGHGIGMSQWGAKAMADEGFTFDEILKFYYDGLTLESIY